MNRRLVSILLAGALSLGSLAFGQNPDSTTTLAAPATASPPVDTAPSAKAPSPDTASVATRHDTAAAPTDSAIPDPAAPPAARSSDHGPGPAGYPRRRMMPEPPAHPEASSASAAEPAVVVPAPAMVADLPFDEDSALEIKLKTDPEAARRYRSPRKAFFFSLLLPGAGQAYCGSWVKMSVFAAAEVGLAVGWYQVAVVASRDKANEAKRFATAHWKQGKYESNWKRLFSKDTTQALRDGAAPQRQHYCNSLYGEGNDASEARQACMDAPIGTSYSLHDRQFGTGNTSPADSVFANIVDQDVFHDLIGRYSEFTPGWQDAADTASVDGLKDYYNALVAHNLDPTKSVPLNPWGVSQMQANYRALRSRSDDLARTQKWFLGGMILNHLVSALDAALQASRMNRTLLHLETTSWMDRLEIDGGFAVVPQLQSHASLAWRF